eukprot:COSAG02_NODE_3242_length_7111_cov_2.874786_3_plen_82_part_00
MITFGSQCTGCRPFMWQMFCRLHYLVVLRRLRVRSAEHARTTASSSLLSLLQHRLVASDIAHGCAMATCICDLLEEKALGE